MAQRGDTRLSTPKNRGDPAFVTPSVTPRGPRGLRVPAGTHGCHPLLGDLPGDLALAGRPWGPLPKPRGPPPCPAAGPCARFGDSPLAERFVAVPGVAATAVSPLGGPGKGVGGGPGVASQAERLCPLAEPSAWGRRRENPARWLCLGTPARWRPKRGVWRAQTPPHCTSPDPPGPPRPAPHPPSR